jgi:putative inorganic carbon (hco3(-)) transporter
MTNIKHKGLLNAGTIILLILTAITLIGSIYLSNFKPSIIGLIIITFILSRKIKGIYLLPLFIPLLFIPTLTSRVNISAAEVFLLTILASWFIDILRKKNFKLIKTKLNTPLLIFTAITIIVTIIPLTKISLENISLTTSSSPLFALRILLIFIESWLVYLYFINNYNKKQKNKVLLSISIATLIISTIGIIQFIITNSRLTSTFPGPNEAGIFLAIMLPLLFTLYIKESKVIYGAAAFIGLIALFFTFSRAALIAAAIGIILSLVLQRRSLKKNKIALVFVVIIILIGLFIGLMPKQDTLHRMKFKSDRPTIWKNSLTLFSQAPLGSGLGTFQSNYQQFPNYNENKEHAHNLYLQILVETGILGFLMLITILIFVLKACIKKKNLFLLGSLISFFVFSFFEHTLYSPQIAIIVFCIFGLIMKNDKTN